MDMSASMKKATGMTNIDHNNRTMKKREQEKNTHIDYSRSDQNNYLIQTDIREIYEEEFGPSLEKYNTKQKRKDRKIDDYYKHISNSKKTATQQEMIIQIGDKDDFSDKWTRKTANEILEKWFEGFQERNPNLKVYNAVIHNDEASPHLHLNFVPVASGYKRGLEKQVSFDRAISQQDDSLDKTRPFPDWREKEVGLLAELMLEKGIDRKLVGTNDYKDVNEYKEKKDLERELEKMRSERDELKSAIESSEKYKNAIQGTIETLNTSKETTREQLESNYQALDKQMESWEKQKRWQQNFSGASSLGQTMQEVKKYKAYVPGKNALGVPVAKEEPRLVSIRTEDYEKYDLQLTRAHQARLVAERRAEEERSEKEKALKESDKWLRERNDMVEGYNYWLEKSDELETENTELKRENTVLQEKVSRIEEVFIRAHLFVDERLPDLGNNQYKKNFHRFLDVSEEWVNERVEPVRQINRSRDDDELGR